ncbi:amidohydrolase [Myxococcus sp. RHSTA-1-4]|uniref:amidohydrolase n=1 Tax=Myxococcus sp. RHSTA-1-4 TaxID=2874601 RepID=UPI001CBAD486|nr:amidohydrolase [Myxococcus sp. RHSTA-1-4]MBZ4415937.1 amidohydrolase [Myxococcus sp. RHSTA-1-4]
MKAPDKSDTREVAERARRLLASLDGVLDRTEALYMDLHQHPELSGHEERTSEKVAVRLEAAGYQVTRAVGGHGVVGVLENGEGPTVALRGDMDALPVEEQTGLPYASHVRTHGADGVEVPVMHACGHDVHTACLVGSAEALALHRELWRGRVIVLAQPAEETISGAKAMLADGLWSRFPVPEVILGQHVGPGPSGWVVHRGGAMMAGSRGLRIRIFGKGGHGSQPHLAVDPVYIGACVVVRLQGIVSRELSPYDSAVVTVGSFHAGTKANIIPLEAVLEITVRAMSDEVMRHILASIERIVRAECEAAHTPRPPEIEVRAAAEVLVNTRPVVARLEEVHRELFADDVQELPFPVTGSEDFGALGQRGDGARIPMGFWLLSSTPRDAWEAAPGPELMGKLSHVPSPHQPNFAPDRERTLHRGVEAMVSASLAFLGAP